MSEGTINARLVLDTAGVGGAGVTAGSSSKGQEKERREKEDNDVLTKWVKPVMGFMLAKVFGAGGLLGVLGGGGTGGVARAGLVAGAGVAQGLVMKDMWDNFMEAFKRDMEWLSEKFGTNFEEVKQKAKEAVEKADEATFHLFEPLLNPEGARDRVMGWVDKIKGSFDKLMGKSKELTFETGQLIESQKMLMDVEDMKVDQSQNVIDAINEANDAEVRKIQVMKLSGEVAEDTAKNMGELAKQIESVNRVTGMSGKGRGYLSDAQFQNFMKTGIGFVKRGPGTYSSYSRT